MKIYTGYLAKISYYIKNDLIPITICGKAPQWYNGIQYKKLAPSWDIYSKYKEGLYTTADYTQHFNDERLSLLKKENVVSELCKLSNDHNIVLLCYEKPGKFCHRHIVVKWLSDIQYVEEFK